MSPVKSAEMVKSYGATTHSYILMGAQTFDTIVHDICNIELQELCSIIASCSIIYRDHLQITIYCYVFILKLGEFDLNSYILLHS